MLGWSCFNVSWYGRTKRKQIIKIDGGKVFTEPLVLFLAHWLSHILCWQSTNIKQMCKRCVEMWFGKSNPVDIFHRPLFFLQCGPSVKVSKVALKIRVGCKLAPTASFKLHFSPQTLFRFGFLHYSVANLLFSCKL